MGRALRLIYVEEEISSHPRVVEIFRRFPRARRVDCRRWGEVFNRRAQNFRLQKRRPALILARKHDHLLLPAPAGYHIGGRRNFYFSHLLNCLYDCRYCFLQGMYRSAHYVLFVNYEDFGAAIDRELAKAPGEDVYFFSGYDCDSLALEGLTGFAREFLPFFRRRPRAWLELRTKSAAPGPLAATPAFPNCVVAWSFTPERAHRRLERGVPPMAARLAAMERLGERGWALGLRFDPLLFSPDYRREYRRLFAEVFSRLRPEWIHSVSFGPFRLPRTFHKRLERLYPDERLFAGPLAVAERLVSYGDEREAELAAFCRAELGAWVPPEKLFPCAPPLAGATGPSAPAAGSP